MHWNHTITLSFFTNTLFINTFPKLPQGMLKFEKSESKSYRCMHAHSLSHNGDLKKIIFFLNNRLEGHFYRKFDAKNSPAI